MIKTILVLYVELSNLKGMTAKIKWMWLKGLNGFR